MFAKDLAALIAEVAEFKEKVKKNPHELKKFLVEKMRPLEDELMLGEENQKHENKSAQEIITEIKRENKETSDAIVKTFEKVTPPHPAQTPRNQNRTVPLIPLPLNQYIPPPSISLPVHLLQVRGAGGCCPHCILLLVGG